MRSAGTPVAVVGYERRVLALSFVTGYARQSSSCMLGMLAIRS